MFEERLLAFSEFLMKVGFLFLFVFLGMVLLIRATQGALLLWNEFRALWGNHVARGRYQVKPKNWKSEQPPEPFQALAKKKRR